MTLLLQCRISGFGGDDYMMPKSDSDLLQDYVREGSNAAFTEFVGRHIDLVYSIALHHVQSSALAADVTQSVFLDVARRAATLGRDDTLIGWLHVAARRRAVDVVRQESRRRARELTAQEISTMSEPSSWVHLRPLLDEAIARLSSVDRTAVLLRYFEQKSLQDVAAALGTSEDAAQKRVSRALERLRVFFARRGVTVAAAGLASDLSAHTIRAAPSPLVHTITSEVGRHVVAGITVTQTLNALSMTTAQKMIAVAALTVVTSAALYQIGTAVEQRMRLTELQELSANQQRQLEFLRAERDATVRKLTDVSQELADAKARAAGNSLDPAAESELDAWLQKVVLLRQHLDRMPELLIPELCFLQPKDWLDVTKDRPLATEMDVRSALSDLRAAAKRRFMVAGAAALARFDETTNGRPPSSVAQLASFFDPPLDPAILGRYAVFDASTASHEIPGGGRLESADGPVKWFLKENVSVDDYYDTTLMMAPGVWAYSPESKFDRAVQEAIQTFKSSNGGRTPRSAAELTSYLNTAIDPEFVQRRLQNRR